MDAKRILHTPEDAARILIPILDGLESEEYWIMCLGADLSPLSVCKAAEGSAGNVKVNVRDVALACLQSGASFAMTAHNHPSGVTAPSEHDVAAAERLESALAGIGVKVLAHLIVAGGRAADAATGKIYAK